MNVHSFIVTCVTVFKFGSIVSCPLGTYHNVTKDECVPCPVDSYQDQEGQLSCKTCPAGSSTWGVKGARWIDYCTGKGKKSQE